MGKGHAYLLFQLCYISSLGSGLKPILLQDGSNGLLLADRFFSVQTVSKCLRRFADVFANPTLLYILEQPINNIISPSEHRFQKKKESSTITCQSAVIANFSLFALVFKVAPPLSCFRQKNYHLRLSCADWTIGDSFAAQKWMEKTVMS